MTRSLILCLCLLAAAVLPAVAQDTSWTRQTSGSTEWLRDVHFADKFRGWAVGDNGTVLASTDEGTTWQVQTTGVSDELHAVDFADSLTGLAAGNAVILKTTDGGRSWASKDLGHAINALRFSSPLVAWATGCEGLILKTTDAGETWSQVLVPDLSSCLEAIDFVDDSTGWIGGYVPGVLLRTTDAGETWTQLADSIDPQQDIDALSFVDREHGWLTGFGYTDTSTIGVVKRTTDGGLSWTAQSSGLTDAILSVAFSDQDRGWAVSSTGVILGTTDGGLAWAPEQAPTTSGLEHLEVLPGEGAWIVGLEGTVLRKNLGGLVPVRILSTSTGWNIVSLPLQVLDATPSVVLPGVTNLPYYYSPGVGYSVSNSLQNGVGYWLKTTPGSDFTQFGAVLDSLSISAAASWNLIGSISDEIPLSNVVTDPPGAITSVFGYTAGSYSTPSMLAPGRGYWVKCTQACTITMYRLAPGAAHAAAAVDSRRLRTDEVPPPAPGEGAVRLAEANIPAVYALHQNYPNPFNPTTTVSFDLPEASRVTVRIYTVLGEEAAELVSAPLGSGTYSYGWNAAGSMPSGVYLCRITAQSLESQKSFTQTMKMMLMK